MLPEKCETVFGQEACNKEVRFSVKSRESEKTTIFCEAPPQTKRRIFNKMFQQLARFEIWQRQEKMFAENPL